MLEGQNFEGNAMTDGNSREEERQRSVKLPFVRVLIKYTHAFACICSAIWRWVFCIGIIPFLILLCIYGFPVFEKISSYTYVWYAVFGSFFIENLVAILCRWKPATFKPYFINSNVDQDDESAVAN